MVRVDYERGNAHVEVTAESYQSAAPSLLLITQKIVDCISMRFPNLDVALLESIPRENVAAFHVVLQKLGNNCIEYAFYCFSSYEPILFLFVISNFAFFIFNSLARDCSNSYSQRFFTSIF